MDREKREKKRRKLFSTPDLIDFSYLTSFLFHLSSKFLLCSFILFFVYPCTFAQWTLQVAAFENTAEAERLHAELLSQKLDAYLEAVQIEGKAVIRVRVGCFDSKLTAEQFALSASLKDFAANPQTLSLSVLCQERLVGAQLPTEWGTYQMNPNRYDAWFKLANRTAFLSFEAGRWHLLQEAQALPNPDELLETSLFQQLGDKVIFQHPGFMPLFITSGKLVWQHQLSAIIVDNNELVAYTLRQASTP